jgi:hypothetical protein
VLFDQLLLKEMLEHVLSEELHDSRLLLMQVDVLFLIEILLRPLPGLFKTPNRLKNGMMG